jgi:hypothetical protein
MKKRISTFLVILSCGLLIACGGDKKEKSAAAIAAEWCELNGKVAKAADGPEKDAAKAAREKWENEIEAKYKDNEAFIKEIQNEAEKCEAASEGK